MNNFFDNQRILELIWKRKIHFIIVGFIAVLLSAVFSGPAFITPKFKSTARIYPVNTSILSEESETEQMLEIVNSNDIRNKIFKAFDLNTVYDIDPTKKHNRTLMLDEYQSNVSSRKTEFETVEIKVLDEDPYRASAMCDSIIHFYNKKMRELYRVKEKEMVDILGNDLVRKKAEVDSISQQLDILKKDYGILDFDAQIPELTRGYMNALATGRGSATDTKKIEELYKNFADMGTEAIWLESRMDYLIYAMDSINFQYDFYLSEYEKEITYAHVVEYPVPDDKKSYPVRWIVVALSTLSAIFLALLLFLVLDYRKVG